MFRIEKKLSTNKYTLPIIINKYVLLEIALAIFNICPIYTHMSYHIKNRCLPNILIFNTDKTVKRSIVHNIFIVNMY